ncbi:PAS domain S-box protein [Acidobacteriota bacterium]
MENNDTKRKMTRANLRLLATVVKDSNDAIIVQDFEGGIKAWNLGAERMYGYTEEEALAMNVREIIPEDLRAETSLLMEKLTKGDSLGSFETKRIAKGGREVDVWLTLTMLNDDEGKPIGVATTERDITERRLSREALKNRERSYRDLLEQSLAGMVIVQKNKCIYRNRAYKEITGALPGFFESTDYKYIHPDLVKRVRSSYQKLLSDRSETMDIDFGFYPADDSGGRYGLKWVHCRGKWINYQGEYAILLHFIDITKNKEMEQLMALDDRMRSLGRVAYGIIHDIRNSLSSINIYLSSLSRMSDRADGFEKVVEIIGKIKESAGNIESTANQVLDFSRTNELDLKMADVNESCEKAVEICLTTLRKSNIRLEKNLSKDLLPRRIDTQLMTRLFVNLILNASDAVKDREDDQRNVLIRSWAEGDRVCVGVSDSGPGIPQDLWSMVFDPFFTTKPESMGIGLTICYRIVSDHGGLLYIRDSEIGGAEFVIELPVGKETVA